MSPDSGKVRFTLNGEAIEARGGSSLLEYLRGDAALHGAKNACGEGACGACSVIVDGSLARACVLPLERIAGKSVTTIEGLPEDELELLAAAFADAGAVQCGFCTPGMVMATKVLLDKNLSPTEAEARTALRGNLCRCTGYAKIVAAVLLAAQRKRDALPPAKSADLAAGAGVGEGVGSSLRRVDAVEKAMGRAKYVDDLSAPGMLFGAALRAPHPRARLARLDVSAARALPGVVAVATWEDIPGKRYIGHVVPDWPSLVAVGELTRYVGDAVALVAAESEAGAREALSLIVAEYEVLEAVASPEAALASGAPRLHPGGNVLSRVELKRGDAGAALERATHVVEASYHTPFTDHAFMEPESALAFPPDGEGQVFARTGEQNVYSGRSYIAHTLGLPEEKVRVASAYVGGAFGGKEDQTVQHHAALLAFLARAPVKCTLSRAESTRVHVKRHAMDIDLKIGCDAEGRLLGIQARIVADTGAYASLGGPVLQRAVVHMAGPYAYRDAEVEGLAVYTNNPPAGAFRGFGVPQVAFALESALDLLAKKVGISPWEMRFRNAVRPGDELPNGQVAGPDTALKECLLAVKEEYEGAAGPVGLACGFKNTGLGVGSRDIGRCRLVFSADRVVVMTGAACIGQGLATVLAQVAGSVLGIGADRIEVALPDTASTPDSGTTTASRQTLVTGEACRRACEAAALALRARGGGQGSPRGGQGSPKGGQSFPYALLAGSEFRGEYFAETDPFDSGKANPVLHVAYSYACHLVVLGPDGRLLRVVAAHDSGLVVNPQAFEGQVEGGVVMGLGYALTEDLALVDCAPPARFGKLGLLRAADIPPIRTIIVRKEGRGGALDGGVTGAAFGAKGIGEISTIPTAAAVGLAYFAMDGKPRTRLPLEATPYRPKDTPA